MAPSPSPSSAPAYAPAQPQSYGSPDPEMPVSPGLAAALDGTGQGYPENRGQLSQPSSQAPRTDPLTGQPTQVQQPQVDPQWAALRQQMGRYGVTLPENLTPEQGYAQIAQAYQGNQQRNYYADVGAAVAPHLDQFTQWQQQQQAVNQPAPQQDTGPWNPPHFDERWMNVVETDPATGQIRSKPGYDPRYGTMTQAYADYMQGQQREFWQNPQVYMQKMLQGHIQQEIQQHIQGSFGQYQEQVQANNLIQRNQQWLYQNDQNGRPTVGPNGRPQLSPNGVRYYQYIEQAAKQYRMPTVAEQNQYAMDMLERDALRAQRSQQVPIQNGGNPQPQRQAPQVPPGAFHQGGNVNGLQQMTPAGRQQVQPTTLAPAGGLSFTEMLREGFQQDGITDTDIRNDMTRRMAPN